MLEFKNPSFILYLFPLFMHLQIQLPTLEHVSSSSDSSDFSSEDDSTVVMKMRSRSPSPQKGKHGSRRSGSRSHSGSRSSSPTQAQTTVDRTIQESEAAGCPEEGSSSQQQSGPEATDKQDLGMWCNTKSCYCYRLHSQLLSLLHTSSTLYTVCGAICFRNNHQVCPDGLFGLELFF